MSRPLAVRGHAIARTATSAAPFRAAADQAAVLRAMLHTRSVRLLTVAGAADTGKNLIAARLAQFAARSLPVLLLDQTRGEAVRELGRAPAGDLDDLICGVLELDQAAGRAGACRYLYAQRGIQRLEASGAPGESLLRGFLHEADPVRLLVLNLDGTDAMLPRLVCENGEVLVITTPLPAALTAAYAQIKQITAAEAARNVTVRVLINGVLDEVEGARIFRSLAGTARDYLGLGIRFAGCVPLEQGRAPYGCVRGAPPDARAAVALEQIASSIAGWNLAAVSQNESPIPAPTLQYNRNPTMYIAAGTLAPQQTIEKFAPLVKKIAHHLQSRLPASVQVDDLIQVGMLGLMDAAARFEDGLGAQFETYASQRIRGAMLDELRQNDWLPRAVRKTQRVIETAVSKVENRLGRPANEKEVAAELGVTLGGYQEMLAGAHGGQMMYYEDMAGEGGSADAFLDRHGADAGADPLTQLQDARFRAALASALDQLPEREKMLMGLYYEQELNFREIAAVMGVTESRVCQLHSQAVVRLRAWLKNS